MLSFVKGVNSILWNYILIFMLCGTGVFFTFKLKFVQIRKFGSAFKRAFGGINLKGKKAGASGMSSFQALTTAIAAQVGTGNLAGAATAIVAGGPGAIFWMWVSAFFGMSTIFGEAVLAQTYKTKVDGQITGGPAYYIRNGLNSKFLAGFFSIAIIISSGFTGSMVQANSIGVAFSKAFDINALIVGIIVAVLAGFIFIGGIRRIAAVTEKLVPIMALMYIIGSLIIIICHGSNVGHVFKMIFVGAFNAKAATGGLIGVGIKETIRYGVSRGLFSNEAGMGSTPHAHAVAKVKYPEQQGLMAMVGVFIDTFVILTLTALVILSTGALDGHTTSIALTQKAFEIGFGKFGNLFVAISLFFFAFSTTVGWYFFGTANIRYLFGKKGVPIYTAFILICIVLGTVTQVQLVWELADTFNGLMVIPNVIALVGLSSIVKKSLEKYESLDPEER